jgi:hypothetical protein
MIAVFKCPVCAGTGAVSRHHRCDVCLLLRRIAQLERELAEECSADAEIQEIARKNEETIDSLESRLAEALSYGKKMEEVCSMKESSLAALHFRFDAMWALLSERLSALNAEIEKLRENK